jgi:hypothetical protein
MWLTWIATTCKLNAVKTVKYSTGYIKLQEQGNRTGIQLDRASTQLVSNGLQPYYRSTVDQGAVTTEWE